MRAEVPVPHGERSSQPGWIAVALRACAPSRPGAWKTTWWQPAIREVSGVHRRVGVVDGGHDRQACRDELSARAGSTSSPTEAASTIA